MYYNQLLDLLCYELFFLHIIGYFGSKIKIAQKEKIINNDDLVMPNLLEFFKKNEIDLVIKIYNNRIKI